MQAVHINSVLSREAAGQNGTDAFVMTSGVSGAETNLFQQLLQHELQALQICLLRREKSRIIQ